MEKILSLSDDLISLYFLVSACEVEFYDAHLLAYAVRNTSSLNLMSTINLQYPGVLHARKQFFDDQVYLLPNQFVSHID